MNKYELGIVVRADLEDENFQAEMTRVKGLIERFEGTIEKVDEWGRRKMAYPIKKLTEGVYTFITFSSPAGAPREIEDRLRLMENVLRFLVIRKDENDITVQVQPEPVNTVSEEVREKAQVSEEVTKEMPKEISEDVPVETPAEPVAANEE